MRLLKRKNDDEFSLTEFYNDDIPPYAILSHTWGMDGEEVTFKDLAEDTGKNKVGYSKIRFCGKQAAIDGLQYFWVDTCCIDKASSAELSEAINSMFRWYGRAAKCYVYLSDVLTHGDDTNRLYQLPSNAAFLKSKWFSRGWTLQELLAPASVQFFSQEGKRLGDKTSLKRQVHEATGIAIQALQGSPLSCFSVAERLSWASQRETKREEDAAYSLLGIFGVHLPAMYGERKENAFSRLLDEIDKPVKPVSLNRTSAPSRIGLSVLIDPGQPALDIVFVHGFTGHPEYTWSEKQEVGRRQNEHNDNDGERPSKRQKLLSSAASPETEYGIYNPIYWPRDLLPIAVPNARVLTYGYDTSSTRSSDYSIGKSTVQDIAWDFLIKLEAARRVESLRPLILVAHSLGGIVVTEALRRSSGCKTRQSHLHSIYENTSGIIFFGTPHGGPNPHELIQHTIKRVIRVDNFKVNDHIIDTFLLYVEQLKDWDERFGLIARDRCWTIISFQEQHGDNAISDKKVVEDTISRLNDPTIENAQFIASSHMEMCRFSGHDDAEYRKVVAAINRIIKATTESAYSSEITPTDTNQRQKFLDRLKFDQIDSRHATIKNAHAKTCKWLLSTSQYKEWLDDSNISDHHGFLWMKGKPGTGKSTLMKFAYANAKKSMADTIVISFFFNARGEDLEKSALGMYRSLLFQLLEKLPDIQDPLITNGSSVPSDFDQDIETVKNLFSRAVECLGRRRLTCFIDALDECKEDQAREMVAFFESLAQFAVSSQIQLHICLSSRYYPYITIEKGVSLDLGDQDGHSQDIANYLHSELKAGRSKVMEKIRDEMLERASGVFLWVVLVIPMLNKEFDRGRIHALQKRLKEIPDDLDALFQDILTRDNENVEDLVLCLQWILYSKRPMKLEELYFAILAGVAADELAAWNPDNITEDIMQKYILSASKGLAEMTKSKHRTVQFIHESVRDFLLKGNGLNSLRSHLDSNFPGSSHERLKECCQTYARIDTSEYLPSNTPLPTASSGEASSLRKLTSEKFPFLEYAVHNVLQHADTADEYGISQTRFVGNFFLSDWIHLDNLFEKYQIRRRTPHCSLLYILSEKNLPHLIRIELDRVQQLDIEGERYSFPLNVALAHKNEVALRVLLLPDTSAWSIGMVPLNRSPSTTTEYQESIKSLLKMGNGINFQKVGSLLSWAAERGDEAVVRLLLETGKVNVDLKDKIHSRTPLLWAAVGGHEAVVRLLLETGKVDIDSKDKDHSRTPLLWAAERGHEAVVRLLLETGKVNIDLKDFLSRTPLLWAAVGGHEAMVRLLLETGKVHVDLKDNFSRTPLSCAAVGGHEAVVRLLLETGKVDVDSKDILSRTPLSWAAERGHEAVVRLLLETGKVDIDSKDKDHSRTPLLWAAERGHEAVVRLLLETGKVDIDSKDKIHSRTPLSWAAERGYEAVVRLLLETGKVDIDLKDNLSRTPLSWAAVGGHEAVVRLLLETGKVDVDSKDILSRTPLSWAAKGGHEAVAKLLLNAREGLSVALRFDGEYHQPLPPP